MLRQRICSQMCFHSRDIQGKQEERRAKEKKQKHSDAPFELGDRLKLVVQVWVGGCVTAVVLTCVTVRDQSPPGQLGLAGEAQGSAAPCIVFGGELNNGVLTLLNTQECGCFNTQVFLKCPAGMVSFIDRMVSQSLCQLCKVCVVTRSSRRTLTNVARHKATLDSASPSFAYLQRKPGERTWGSVPSH